MAATIPVSALASCPWRRLWSASRSPTRSCASAPSSRGSRRHDVGVSAGPEGRDVGLIDHIRTRVTERLGIRYPILQAGMIWASSYKLAVACAEADILGTIGSASMKPDFLREQLQKARTRTKKRVAVNSPLLRKDAPELLEITLEEGIDIVISSAGNPAVLGPRIKASGAIWIHVVPSVKHGKKAQDSGADIVIGEGTEAGGHNGVD